jgi:gas vesicle protein
MGYIDLLNATHVMSGTGNFIAGILVGAAAGLVTGLLIAPTSGNQTRRNIVQKSRVYSQQAVDAVRHYLENIRQGKVKGDTALSSSESEALLSQLKRTTNT